MRVLSGVSAIGGAAVSHAVPESAPMHRLTRILSTALITAGLVVLLDAAATLLWQEPVSAAYGAIQQSRADGELADLTDDFLDSEAADVGDIAADERARVLA